MYKVSDLMGDYQSLQEDNNLLLKLQRNAENKDDYEVLLSHNHHYRYTLIHQVQDNFPTTANDVSAWGEGEFVRWLKMLIAYPVFWQGKQEMLVGLLWSLDSKGQLLCKEEVAEICTHSTMLDYLHDSPDGTVVQALNVLLDKYATLSQAEQFQNGGDLGANEID